MIAIQKLRILLIVSVAFGMAGCFTLDPAATDWHKTPKIVLQVCSMVPDAKSAEIILFRSSGRLSLRSGPIPPQAKNLAGQYVFESIWEDPRSFHEAIGVQVEAEGNQEFFVFASPDRYSEDWSPWVVPTAVEHDRPKDINGFRYKVEQTALSAEIIRKAPRLRYRLEYQARYQKARLLPERYEGIPGCS